MTKNVESKLNRDLYIEDLKSIPNIKFKLNKPRETEDLISNQIKMCESIGMNCEDCDCKFVCIVSEHDPVENMDNEYYPRPKKISISKRSY